MSVYVLFHVVLFKLFMIHEIKLFPGNVVKQCRWTGNVYVPIRGENFRHAEQMLCPK